MTSVLWNECWKYIIIYITNLVLRKTKEAILPISRKVCVYIYLMVCIKKEEENDTKGLLAQTVSALTTELDQVATLASIAYCSLNWR